MSNGLGDLFKNGPTPEQPVVITSRDTHYDWGNSPDIQHFFGRVYDIKTTCELLTNGKCRLLSIIGMKGMGKSSLSLRVCKGLSDNSDEDEFCIKSSYEYIMWLDMLNAPSLSEVLVDVVGFVSNYQENLNNLDTNKLISTLLQHFKSKKCLIVLDNFESVLQSGEQDVSGQYIKGYENYESFFSTIGRTEHKSCVLINSREQPHGFSMMVKSSGGMVNTHKLLPLDTASCRKIFEIIDDFEGTDEDWEKIATTYNGNPFALQLLARHISEIYFGCISEFLHSNNILFGEINELIKWHVDRLSNRQLETFLWMAIYREPVSCAEIQSRVLGLESRNEVPTTIQSLMERLPIERIVKTRKFSLQPILIEFATKLLIDRFVTDLQEHSFLYLGNYALFPTNTKESVQEMLRNVLLTPINQNLINALGGQQNYEQSLITTLDVARQVFQQKKNYVAGNIINLLSQIKDTICNYNFSNLSISEANLQNISLHQVNFDNSTIDNCKFRQTFGPISSVTISSDGNYVAANEATGKIHIWRTLDDQIVHNLSGHISWIFGLTFSHDNKLLASGGEDKTVRLWDLENNAATVLGAHKKSVWTIAFSSDDKMLASGGGDCCIMIFDTATHQCIKSFKAHTDEVFSVAFSSDNSILISASTSNEICLWDVKNHFSLIKKLNGHHATVRCVSYNENNSHIASCDWQGKIIIWDAKTFYPIIENTLNQGEPLHYISHHPTYPIIAACSEKGSIYIWNYVTNTIEKKLNKHHGEVWKVEFSSDGRYLVSGGYDGTLIIWDVESWTCKSILRGYIDWIQDISITPDDKMLACSNGDLTINVWDVESAKNLCSFPAHSGWIFSLKFSPNGELLASASDDLTIKLWKTSGWNSFPPLIFTHHKKWIQDITFSKDGKYLVSGDYSGQLLIWDVENKTIQCELIEHDNGIWAVTLSSDGTILASAGEDSNIILWSWAERKPLTKLLGHTDRIHELCFNTKSNYLYSCSEDCKVIQWEISLNSGIELYTHTSWAMAMALTADDKYIFSGDKEGYIIRYNLLTKEKNMFKAHDLGIWAIEVFHNDRFIVSAGEDGYLKIWDKESLVLVKTLSKTKPYEGLKICNISGLTVAQTETLIQLGAIK